MNRKIYWLIVALLTLMPAAVRACTLDIDTVGSTNWSGGDGRGYDVFDATVYYQPLSIKITSQDGDCAFYATVAASSVGGAGGVLTGGNGQIVFEVYRDASGAQALRPAPLATQSEVLVGTILDKGPPAFFQVAYSIPALQIVPPGTYAGQITLAIYEGQFGSGLLRAQKQVPLSIFIPSIAELSLATDTFNAKKKEAAIDFGVMYEGEIRGLTMHARGNGGYRMMVSSQNGGVMRPRDPLDESAVTYTLSIDGRPLKLGRSDIEAMVYQGITSAQGNPHRVDVSIDSLRDSTAGDYEDTVSVTIMSLR